MHLLMQDIINAQVIVLKANLVLITCANIVISADFAMDVHVADMDNDGDLDIVSASIDDDTIAWYENDLFS